MLSPMTIILSELFSIYFLIVLLNYINTSIHCLTLSLLSLLLFHDYTRYTLTMALQSNNKTHIEILLKAM